MTVSAAIEPFLMEMRQMHKEMLDKMGELYTSARQEAKEDLEREGKKNNCVVVGAPERPTEEETVRADKEMMSGLYEQCGILPADLVDLFRDGRSRHLDNGQVVPRIIKVRFRTYAAKKLFLTKGTYVLRSHYFAQSSSNFKPFVRPDLTLQQRVEDQNLRVECRNRNTPGNEAYDPNAYWKVLSGHIVKKTKNAEG